MATKSVKTCPASGRFKPGVSGNPSGRPKGTSSHATELRRLEEDAIVLATNVADVILETMRLAFTEIGEPENIPLIEAITDATKEAARDGEIGPSSVALLRNWYDDHLESDPEGAFFSHVGLPLDCSWGAFRSHYTRRKRIDNSRHAGDLLTFPSIAKAIKSRLENAV